MRYCEKELPFTVLQKAVEGDPDAIAYILKWIGYTKSDRKNKVMVE